MSECAFCFTTTLRLVIKLHNAYFIDHILAGFHTAFNKLEKMGCEGIFLFNHLLVYIYMHAWLRFLHKLTYARKDYS